MDDDNVPNGWMDDDNVLYLCYDYSVIEWMDDGWIDS